MVKTEPIPTVLSAVTSPPMARARSRLMARPRPTPREAVAADPPAASGTNGEKMRCSWSASMPIPSSRTRMRARSPSESQRIDHSARRRELDPVREEVQQNLLQPIRIGHGGDVVAASGNEPHARVRRLHANQTLGARYRAADRNGARVHLNAPRLEPGKFEDVVDHRHL